jgi:hypothetical protein
MTTIPDTEHPTIFAAYMGPLIPPTFAGLREPDLVQIAWELSWIVSEAVTVALDGKEDAYSTSVYYYREELGTSKDEHTGFIEALGRVKALLDGAWRDYFSEQTLASLDEEKVHA